MFAIPLSALTFITRLTLLLQFPVEAPNIQFTALLEVAFLQQAQLPLLVSIARVLENLLVEVKILVPAPLLALPDSPRTRGVASTPAIVRRVAIIR